MTTANSRAIDEAQIRGLINDRINAVRAKDVDTVMSHHAPDILTFDVVNPLQYTGLDAARKRAEEWFSSFQGPIGYEIRDLSIATGDDVAFCHYLFRVSGTLTGGEKVGMWVRTTSCYRKIDGTWLVMHEHNSVPFNTETGRASLDLQP
jgi:uncharacterized protein (TIGR02246 family)